MGKHTWYRPWVSALWMVVLTLPIFVVRVNTVVGEVTWRWRNAVVLALLVVTAAYTARVYRRLERDAGWSSRLRRLAGWVPARYHALETRVGERRLRVLGRVALALVLTAFPFVTGLFQTGIMVRALIFVLLALGLNVIIGLGGMLHLGYIAFMAVGAYTYGILYRFFGVGFWPALPAAALVSTVAGISLALPVLRLRGDYLAIVTLGFSEIVRIVINNLTELTGGPQGILGIPKPWFFGLDLSLRQSTRYLYFIALAFVILLVCVMRRFENSRIGRALTAMGEDEIAAAAMGVDTTRAKLVAFALGSFWAGIAGVIFASQNAIIVPSSFSIAQSIIVLSCVVLGGMGSIRGSIVGALALILIPEYLREFSDFRILIFGVVLVVMMIFRPGGILPKQRKVYTFGERT